MTFSQLLPHGFCFSGSSDSILLPEKYAVLSSPLWQHSLWLRFECASYFGRAACPKEQTHTPAKTSDLHKRVVTFPDLSSSHLDGFLFHLTPCSLHCTSRGDQQL